MNQRLTNERVYRAISPAWQPGDLERRDRFFNRHRGLKKGDFERDAILAAMDRYDADLREREAITSGRTQIDPSLVGRA